VQPRSSIAPSQPVAGRRDAAPHLQALAIVAGSSWVACSFVPPLGTAVEWPFWLVRMWFALCLCAPPALFAWARPGGTGRRRKLAWVAGWAFVTAILIGIEPQVNHAWWQGSIPEEPGDLYWTILRCTVLVVPIAVFGWPLVAAISGRPERAA
jgi:hypothetical protein